MAMIWPGGITTSGLLDLSMNNVNESGAFVHTIKNMPEGSSKLFVLNCGLDFNSGWGLALVNVDKLLVANNTMKSTSVDVRNINAPTRTWPQDLKNSHNVICRNNSMITMPEGSAPMAATTPSSNTTALSATAITRPKARPVAFISIMYRT